MGQVAVKMPGERPEGDRLPSGEHATVIRSGCHKEAALGAVDYAIPARGEQMLGGAVTLMENGFAAENVKEVSAPPAEVWAALVTPSRYWDPEHSYSGDAANISLDLRPGGCLCERLPDGGFAEHMRVVLARPGRTLRLSGALGPLQSEALVGTLTWELDETGEGGTHIRQIYMVGGLSTYALDEIAPAVDAVLNGQLQRLGGLFGEGRMDE